MDEQKNTLLSLDVKFKVKDVLRYNLSVARKNIVNCIVMAFGLGVLVYFFYKMFTEKFGCTPKEYRKNKITSDKKIRL